MPNPLVPDSVTPPMGPWEAQFAQYLQPTPGWSYGNVLPLAQNDATGAVRPAMPGFVRDLAQGALQLFDGPATGTVTPQATMALASLPVASGLAAGADAAGGNALASGPIVAYHGSPYDFDAFDLGKAGTTTDSGDLGRAVYFSTDPSVTKTKYWPKQYEASVDLKNPYQLQLDSFGKSKSLALKEKLGLDPKATSDEVTDELQKRGHDGVVLDYSNLGWPQSEIAAFDPATIAILRKYGLAAMLAGGGADAIANAPQQGS